MDIYLIYYLVLHNSKTRLHLMLLELVLLVLLDYPRGRPLVVLVRLVCSYCIDQTTMAKMLQLNYSENFDPYYHVCHYQLHSLKRY